ncbi:MAG: metal-dependent hydrolase, partial [Gemmatimonadetes bacterium]|nr:metal-dependent hydrolase [Gemmatimonadota bacterium]
STLFIIDPLFTLPLLVGVIAAMASGGEKGRRRNRMGLLLSTGYLLLSIAAKLHVDGVVRETLRGDPGAGSFTSGATPFNILLWRVVAMDSRGYRIGYYSLFDDAERVRFARYPDDRRLLGPISGDEAVADLKRATKGFFEVRLVGSEIQMADLRMGFEPAFVFRFVVGVLREGRVKAVPNRRVGGGPDVMTFGWFWRRIWDESLPPPHPGK